MRLVTNFRMQSVQETAAAITTEVLNEPVSCKLSQAVALFGITAMPAGSKDDLPKALFSLFIDGERVLENAGWGTISFKDFLKKPTFYDARTPDGDSSGLFMVHSTVVKILAWTERPFKVSARIEAALYSTEGAI